MPNAIVCFALQLNVCHSKEGLIVYINKLVNFLSPIFCVSEEKEASFDSDIDEWISQRDSTSFRNEKSN